MATGSKGALALLRQISKTPGMPSILPAPPAPSRATNGTTVFVPSISRIHLLYPPHTSPGMTDFIRKSLPAIAKEFPYCEFLVQPAPKRWPEVKATYNGAKKSVYVKKMSMTQVERVVREMVQAAGRTRQKYYKPVISGGQKSVIDIWDPFRNQTFRP